MPMAVVLTKLNAMLSGDDMAAYDQAAAIVSDVTRTVADAVQRSGVYDGTPSPQVAEARRVFGALPRSVDRTIMAALRSALDGPVQIPVRVSWVETLSWEHVQVHVHEKFTSDTLSTDLVDRAPVLIQLSCPPGNMLP